jgi:hypothetical protein
VKYRYKADNMGALGFSMEDWKMATALGDARMKADTTHGPVTATVEMAGARYGVHQEQRDDEVLHVRRLEG